MSDNVNSRLLEDVADLIDEYAPGTYTEALEQALTNNDLELLYELKSQSGAFCVACGEERTANCNNANCSLWRL